MISLRVSKKDKTLPRINLMLYEQHFSFVKNVNALLFDQTKHKEAKYYCMLRISGFSRSDLLEEHEKYCKGLNGRPTRILMPKDGPNILKFNNHNKQMPMPLIIYADIEAMIKKIRYNLPQEKEKSFTVKTEKHEACGFSYVVVRSDGEVFQEQKTYRGGNPVKNFLREIQEEEKKIRECLKKRMPILKTGNWQKFSDAKNCHVCGENLVK